MIGGLSRVGDVLFRMKASMNRMHIQRRRTFQLGAGGKEEPGGENSTAQASLSFPTEFRLHQHYLALGGLGLLLETANKYARARDIVETYYTRTSGERICVVDAHMSRSPRYNAPAPVFRSSPSFTSDSNIISRVIPKYRSMVC